MGILKNVGVHNLKYLCAATAPSYDSTDSKLCATEIRKIDVRFDFIHFTRWPITFRRRRVSRRIHRNNKSSEKMGWYTIVRSSQTEVSSIFETYDHVARSRPTSKDHLIMIYTACTIWRIKIESTADCEKTIYVVNLLTLAQDVTTTLYNIYIYQLYYSYSYEYLILSLH